MTDAFRDESRRQAQELADAIQETVHAYGRRLTAERRAPSMNALAGALAGVTGTMLAAIPDARTRKLVRSEMDRAIRHATTLAAGNVTPAQIVVLGDKLQ